MIVMKRIFLPAVMLAGCAALAACNNAEQRAENVGASVEASADAAADRIENSVDNTVAALTPAPNPQDFVNRAAKSDAFEIAAARLAAKNAASPAVKSFAEQMITAHTDSTAKIKAAAAKANPALTPNAALTADQNEDLAELGRLSGAKFDEEYVDGQVDAHEDALGLMRSFAADGADAGLKAVAAGIAPAVEGHLKMARELEAKTDR
jgi:putative membrane protein